MTRLAAFAATALALLSLTLGVTSDDAAARTEVVVLLESRPLARDADAAATIEVQQRTFRRELARELPDARVGWSYRLVANGFSVSLPESEVPQLRALAGVRDVLAAGGYEPQLASTPEQIGARALWGATLDTAGQGVKIGIIDSGIDATHPFFDPTGYAMPQGFPKGQRAFTTAKVIVARVFAPAGTQLPSTKVPYDERDSSHGTHVAGIAAGNADTPTGQGRVSGVAPRAYLGNYKVFVETDAGVSPNANAPAIVAAIEAAVADGMDVINFSGGEPEIEPSRDVVALALDAAAAAGVVPVVAAGNDYSELGAGSVASPSNSARAISVGAVDVGGTPTKRVHAGFSSVGPTTISHRLKPDVAAPGVAVLSSVDGDWAALSGTSMAAPHVAGAAGLLVQRHPTWTPDQVRSALVQTGVDAVNTEGDVVGPQFQGGGVVGLGKADQPLVFARPSSLSFGLFEGRGWAKKESVTLEDAGGGAGTWSVRLQQHQRAPGVSLDLATSNVSVPGELAFEVRVAGAPRAGELSGYLVLRRGAEVRRIPYWGRRTAQGIARQPFTTLRRAGVIRSTTTGRRNLVSRYRYPENPRGVGVTTVLRGPERVYRLRLTKRAANFGVVITQRGRSSRVEPRVVAGFDENRLTGYAGLPVNHNPYSERFREPVLAAGALSPAPGEYAVVFDSASRSQAGTFSFRYWVNDVTPPTLRLRTRAVARGSPVLVSATDAGAGIYPESVFATLDGDRVDATFRRGVVSVSTAGLESGLHRLRVRISDYQESKNTENVARILPNTRWLTATFRVR